MRDHRQQFRFPPIAAIANNFNRPFWSVMIPVYNRTVYLNRVLQSVLAQNITAEEMQIEVIDNSSKATEIEAIVRDIGRGRISYYKQLQTVNMSANWNTCIDRASGYWVHILHDDDLVLPEFYQAYRRTIEASDCVMVASQAILIDEAEDWLGISDRVLTDKSLIANAVEVLSSKSILLTPSVVVKRDAYEKVGGFSLALQQVSDWEMWSRLATFGSVGWVKKPYCLYRIHSQSITHKNTNTGTNLTDCLEALAIIEARIEDSELRRRVKNAVNRWLWESSYFTGLNFAFDNNVKATLFHARFLIQLNPNQISSYPAALKLIRLLIVAQIKALLQRSK